MEIWKPIKDYENLYEVSNLGRVRSKDKLVDYKPHGLSRPVLKKGAILKPTYNKETGYKTIGLWKTGNQKTHSVHILVAEVFCKKLENAECVNHKNGRKLDNRANNLEWITYSENNYHAYKTNLKQAKRQAVYCEELKRKFVSANEAAIYIKDNYNIDSKLSTIRGNIRACAKGKRLKTAYKYHWKHI